MLNLKFDRLYMYVVGICMQALGLHKVYTVFKVTCLDAGHYCLQTALDEFDYHVDNLATDLRDGLRIT